MIFLDSDIIVRADIKELWETNIENYYIAAAENPVHDRLELNHRLNIPIECPYFNAGVLLMNLTKWRAEDLTGKIIEYINNNSNKLLLWDQDALNANLHGCWKKLPLKWNVQPTFFKDLSSNETGYSTLEIAKGIENPAILHYSTKFKPWHYWCDHPMKYEYFLYLKRTPWKSFRIKEEPVGAS